MAVDLVEEGAVFEELWNSLGHRRSICSKTAGCLAASWEAYRVVEDLVEVCAKAALE